MNCHIIVHTECCAHNCSKAEDENTSLEEYEVGETESDEEDIDSHSTKTIIG